MTQFIHGVQIQGSGGEVFIHGVQVQFVLFPPPPVYPSQQVFVQLDYTSPSVGLVVSAPTVVLDDTVVVVEVDLDVRTPSVQLEA